MPCPYFLPSVRTSIAALPHPERLPLGGTYSGQCTAANVVPTTEMLHDCNLGYAMCDHLPAMRSADAVRFLTRRTEPGRIAVNYVCESHYSPVSDGMLIFDVASNSWQERHPNACLQRMAECCVESFRSRS